MTLELALSRTPTIVAYKVPKIEEWIARRLIQVNMVAQPNIILGEMAFPEPLQDEANGAALAAKLGEIIEDSPERRRQLEAVAAGWAKNSALPTTKAQRKRPRKRSATC